MNELSPEQKEQITSWVSQRDLLLVDIANLRTEKEKLTLLNKNLAESNTDVQDRINRGIGRLEELDKKEKLYEEVVSTELSDLTAQKTQLEGNIEGLKKEIVLLVPQKETLVDLILNLTSIHNKLSESAVITERAVGIVTKANSDNAKEIDGLLATVKEQVGQIVAINAGNVEKTNAVIAELPRIIFELQRDILERKKFNKTKHT